MSTRCPPRAFCPHQRKCISCERWSCGECGIVCGDGEEVAAVVEASNAAAVFVDFDRTMCTTKTGSSPMQGRHSVDPELAGLAAAHPCVHVVTRNSHVDDIREFLTREGVPASVGVHHVGKGKSKADVIRALLREGVTASGGDGEPPGVAAVFVDDSIAELLDDQVAAVPELTRVLFSRVLA